MGLALSRRGVACALAALLALAGLGSSAEAQGRASRVRAHLDSGVVTLGDQVTLYVTVENATSAELKSLPAVEGLELGAPGQPGVRRTESWHNGRVTRSSELTWAIRVRPLAKGDHVIPPIDVLVDGQTVQTAAVALTVVQDLRGEELGFFEVRASSPKVVEGQPFSIELRFGWDQALQGRINYANLALPWWGQLPGVLEMEPPPARPGVQQHQIELNTSAQVVVDEVEPETVRGRPFRTFRLVRSFTPTRSGKLEFPTSFLEFGRVVERRDFFNSSRERAESYFVRAEGFAVEVVPLPEEGRPLDFSGAIGTLSVRASAEPRDVDAGESIKLSVEWTGAGNLEFFTAPDPSRMGAFKGFRVYGMTESKAFDRRTVVYDIAPMSSELEAIPPLPLSVFDPELGRYVEVATEPIAIRVRPLEHAARLGAEDGEESFERDLRDIEALAAADVSSSGGLARPGPAAALGVCALAPILWLSLRTAVRRRGDPASPQARRRRRARKMLVRALDRAGTANEQLAALHEFLGARTGETPQAWLGRDPRELATREEATVDGARIEALARVVGELESSLWGGDDTPLERARIVALADDLLRGGL